MQLILPIILVVFFGAWIWFLKRRVVILRDRLDAIETAQEKKRKAKEAKQPGAAGEEDAGAGPIKTFEIK